jgi:hypothetical protein
MEDNDVWTLRRNISTSAEAAEPQLNKSPEQPSSEMQRENGEYFAELAQRSRRNDLEAKFAEYARQCAVWRDSAALLIARSSGRYGSPFSMEPADLQTVVPTDIENIAGLVDVALRDDTMWVVEPSVANLDEEDETMDSTFPVGLAIATSTSATSSIPMLSPSTSDKTVFASQHESPLFKAPSKRRIRRASPPAITASQPPPPSSAHSLDYPALEYESVQDLVKRRKRKRVTSGDILGVEPSTRAGQAKRPRKPSKIATGGRSSLRKTGLGDAKSAQPPSPPSSQNHPSPPPSNSVATTSPSFEYHPDQTRSEPGCSKQHNSKAPSSENGRAERNSLPQDSQPSEPATKRKRAEEQESDFETSESDAAESDSDWGPPPKRQKCAEKQKRDSSKRPIPLFANKQPRRSTATAVGASNDCDDGHTGPSISCNYRDPLECYAACTRVFSRLPDMDRHQEEHHRFKEAKAAYRPAHTSKKLEKGRATAVITAAISRLLESGEREAESEAMKGQALLESQQKRSVKSLKINLSNFPLLEVAMEEVARAALDKFRCSNCGCVFTRPASMKRHKEKCPDP